MALDKNSKFFKLTFDNKTELMVSSDKTSNIKDFLTKISSGLGKSEYLELNHDKISSIYIKRDTLFSVQEMAVESLGTQQRVWSIT